MSPTATKGTPRELAVAGYATALILLLLPLSDTLVALLPHRPGDVGWRFGAFGLASRALVSPLLALFLLLALATVFGDPRARRLVGIAGLGFSLIVVAALPLFVLDAIQMRADVAANVRGAFDITVGIAIVKYLCALAVTWAIVRAARRGKSVPAPSSSVRPPEQELLGAFRAPTPLARSRESGVPSGGNARQAAAE